MVPMWAPELGWLWVKRRQISFKVSCNTAWRHSEGNSSLRRTPLAHKVFMLVQFMLSFLFITPRHPTRSLVTRLLKRVTKVAPKHSHCWAEISMQRPRQLNNREVFVWRIGAWDGRSILPRIFSLLCSMFRCSCYARWTPVSLQCHCQVLLTSFFF